MEGGGGTVINYLGYKFLLFCKVSTQPQRGIACWVCSGETEQPGPRQMLLMVGTREEMRARVGSNQRVAWAEGKDPRKRAKEWGRWELPRAPRASPSSSSPTVFLPLLEWEPQSWAALSVGTHPPGQTPAAAFTAGAGGCWGGVPGTSASSSVKWG